MNTTGNRRQVELLGSSVSSAMRCPSSKRSVCQSKRRVRAVSTTAWPIRRGPGAPEVERRIAGHDFPTGSAQAAFLSGLREGSIGRFRGSTMSVRTYRRSPEAFLFWFCLQYRIALLEFQKTQPT